MIRRRVAEQTRMRRGYGGWELVRPDRSRCLVPAVRNSRLSERLMREALQDSNLEISYHRVLVGEPAGAEKTPVYLIPPRTVVVLPEPVDEPAEWSPFDADGKLDTPRLKKEGFHLTGVMEDDR